MIRFKNISNPYWRNMVSRVALIIVAVVLIVLFLPRTQGKLFHYDEGKPWMYGQLIAKFDFPIFKTDAALKIEKDSITKHFQPYYNINQTVEQKKIEQFKQAYKMVYQACQKTILMRLPTGYTKSMRLESLIHNSTLHLPRTVTIISVS